MTRKGTRSGGGGKSLPHSDGIGRCRGPDEDDHETKSPTQATMHTAHSAERMQVRAQAETEREKLARDIHDLSGQHIVAVMLQLSALEAKCDDPALAARFAEIRAILTQLSNELHDISQGAKAGVPSGSELVETLSGLVAQWEKWVGIPARFDRQLTPGIIPSDEVAEAIFRIVQEGLTNVAAHAATASQAAVRVRLTADEIEVEIEDDGPGFNSIQYKARSPENQHTGIAGMLARVAKLGGHFAIKPRQEKGTRLTAVIPLIKPEAAVKQ